MKAQAAGRCCINQCRAKPPLTSGVAVPKPPFADNPFSESIENGGSDVQFVDLALEGSRHDPLARAFNSVHLGRHQAASAVTTPVFPELAPEAPACGSRHIAVHKGSAFAQRQQPV